MRINTALIIPALFPNLLLKWSGIERWGRLRILGARKSANKKPVKNKDLWVVLNNLTVDKAIEIIDNLDKYKDLVRRWKKTVLMRKFTWKIVGKDLLQIIKKYYWGM